MKMRFHILMYELYCLSTFNVPVLWSKSTRSHLRVSNTNSLGTTASIFDARGILQRPYETPLGLGKDSFLFLIKYIL